MAWFSNKTEEKNESDLVNTSTSVSDTNNHATTAVASSNVDILKRPHVTEKAFGLSQKNVYTFEVDYNANKYQIIQAIKDLYSVTPKKVCITRQKPRKERSLLRNRTAHKNGLKKAYVYLKEGDTINFM